MPIHRGTGHTSRIARRHHRRHHVPISRAPASRALFARLAPAPTRSCTGDPVRMCPDDSCGMNGHGAESDERVTFNLGVLCLFLLYELVLVEYFDGVGEVSCFLGCEDDL